MTTAFGKSRLWSKADASCTTPRALSTAMDRSRTASTVAHTPGRSEDSEVELRARSNGGLLVRCLLGSEIAADDFGEYGRDLAVGIAAYDVEIVDAHHDELQRVAAPVTTEMLGAPAPSDHPGVD